ncbi:hypothetical protein LCGC14_2986380 [marine sediment metagenome]|uniref:Uncharacterized protein n=1 Tax=marine sediment metagenome TaxID=412755 RepID=A0A0F8ZCJ1_9ZZZZ
MGYSCSTKANMVLDSLIVLLQSSSSENNSSNTWEKRGIKYFYEIGKENIDGAITGKVNKFVEENQCKVVRSFRIESNGKITRFIGSTKQQRTAAETAGLMKFYTTYNKSWSKDEVLPEHIRSSKFAVV